MFFGMVLGVGAKNFLLLIRWKNWVAFDATDCCLTLIYRCNITYVSFSLAQEQQKSTSDYLELCHKNFCSQG
jgi:hypothetical protein